MNERMGALAWLARTNVEFGEHLMGEDRERWHSSSAGSRARGAWAYGHSRRVRGARSAIAPGSELSSRVRSSSWSLASWRPPLCSAATDWRPSETGWNARYTLSDRTDLRYTSIDLDDDLLAGDGMGSSVIVALASSSEEAAPMRANSVGRAIRPAGGRR